MTYSQAKLAARCPDQYPLHHLKQAMGRLLASMSASDDDMADAFELDGYIANHKALITERSETMITRR